MASSKNKKLSVVKFLALASESDDELVVPTVIKRKKLKIDKIKKEEIIPVTEAAEAQSVTNRKKLTTLTLSSTEPVIATVEPVITLTAADPVVSTPTQPDQTDPPITYSVDITSLDTATINGLDNAVVTVSWVVSGTDGTNTVSYPGSIMVGSPKSADFIAYANLTKADVLEWIPNPLSPGMVGTIDNSLALMRNPSVSNTPPWI